MSDSNKRYIRDYLISMVLYCVVLTGVIMLYEALPQHPASALLMLLPLVPILFAFRAFIRWVRELDEMQKRIQMEAFAFSLGLTSILTFTYGLMERAGLPQISLIWVFPLSVMLWGIGHLFANGDLASLILFGGLSLYGAAHLALGLAHGIRPSPEVRAGHDILSLIAGVALYIAMVQLHPVLIGVPVLTLS